MITISGSRGVTLAPNALHGAFAFIGYVTHKNQAARRVRMAAFMYRSSASAGSKADAQSSQPTTYPKYESSISGMGAGGGGGVLLYIHIRVDLAPASASGLESPG